MLNNQKLGTYLTPRRSTDLEGSLTTCRVCQCMESDRRGDAALGFLDIIPPSHEIPTINDDQKSNCLNDHKGAKSDIIHAKNCEKESGVTEFISPTGEVFICNVDLEADSNHYQDRLINLGCSCKCDLALAHYACALKWFVNYGSTICEICGSVAMSVRPSDFEKVVVSLKDYEKLMEKTVSGQPISAYVRTGFGVDPDAVAGIRRQRLSEIALWFNLHMNKNGNSSNNSSTIVSPGVIEHSSDNPTQGVLPNENPGTKMAFGIAVLLVAIGILTVTLSWLIAPRVGKRTAKIVLHILLVGLCALAGLITLRLIMLTRINFGPVRYWAIVLVFWLFDFVIWASQTHGAHKT